jgi:hypothetical protein
LERDWKEQIHAKLLTVMDLSLISSLENAEAAAAQNAAAGEEPLHQLDGLDQGE